MMISDKERLLEVYAALQMKGYRPIDQIVGYILTEDPTYITNHAGARQLAAKINRNELLKDMLLCYFSEMDSGKPTL